MAAFNWPALMRAGMLGLGLKPAEFWALTPAELLFLCGANPAARPLLRDRLEELARLYPDKTGDLDG